MDINYINTKDLKHRSDVAVWNGVAYVAGIDHGLSAAHARRGMRRPIP